MRNFYKVVLFSVLTLGLVTDVAAVDPTIIEDFESGLPAGTDGNGIEIGYSLFSDGSPVAMTTTSNPPADEIGDDGNSALQFDANVTAFGGVLQRFQNATADMWVTQDWSGSEGVSLWLYGLNTNNTLFFDILDNRNPGSTTDDAERWTVEIIDNFSGWLLFEFPFASFSRKEIGNGAPNDGFTLTEVNGWALGTLATGAELTYFLDNIAIYGEAQIPELTVSFSSGNYDTPEGTSSDIIVKLNREMLAEDPAEVSIDFYMEPGSATPGRDYTPASGTLTFVNGGETEQSFDFETFDNNKYTGDKRVILRLANAVDVTAAFAQATGTIVDDESFDASLLDDFETYPYLWAAHGNVLLDNPEIASGDPDALPGQGDWERVLEATIPLMVDADVKGRICNKGNGVVPVVLYSTDTFDATQVDHTTVSLGDAYESHRDKKTGTARRHEEDVNNDGEMDLVFHFKFADTGLPCDPDSAPVNGWTFDGQPISAGAQGASFRRDFAIGQDWSSADGLSFWYYGQNTGDTITVQLLDNRAADPGPAGWTMVWSDEFNEPAGTPPNPAHWGYEIGDGTVNGIPGWGNDELQYYTDSTENAATDGNGNLLITTAEADGSLQCYYGPCEYTSARLLSQRRAEFAYGRIEARILLPDGEDGLWPAFWSLGTDIGQVGWPQTGEIDFMEYVSRLPNEIFGTIHGPGYSGGQSYGDIFDFGEPASNDYHTFAIEWQPDLIKWYVDGILYHTAAPADVAPNQWVFNDPVFMLLNQAVGGNFGGEVSDELVFPQVTAIDYVRVYQGPDTAERFASSFVDDFEGWQLVEVAFEDFGRSSEQPDGAPDDGLTLNEVWGYGFALPDGGSASGYLMLDQVRLVQFPKIVTNLDDSGPGSLRQAFNTVLSGGTILFDPALAGGTIALTSGPLVTGNQFTVDAVDAPGIVLDGGGSDRILIADPGADITVRHLVMTHGFGFQLGGAIINNGELTLDHVTVTNNLMATDSGDFWQGGGGIYNGEGSVLNLVDSTVSNNSSGFAAGGIYSFFNSTVNIERSTISNNLAMDVGGGLRTLGNVSIDNSTISGNVSTPWHGGAVFSTDGVVNVSNSTVTGNSAPPGTAGGFFLGTFGAAPATLNLHNTIIASNGDFGCFLAPFGPGPVAINSRGNSVYTDGTCAPVASDQVVADAGLAPLADNGGPTQTHALLPGSPAIDSAEHAACPATDQRGVDRDSACDVGSYEFP
ncbi:MAG: family 16 glycosylhydrolase [Xanthomonadales bacterium]|nr:family 16 glycosylhydrolase [Xanthomonadales bacterium]MDH4000572.1 family 16 glycosylhydrolase [Xanthomonadales bacterium]